MELKHKIDLEDIIKNVRDIIIVLDFKARLKYFTSKLRKILGEIPIKQGDSFFNYIYSNEANSFKEAFSKSRNNPNMLVNRVFELRFQHRSQDYIFMEAVFTKYFNKEGKFTGFIGSLRDISKYRESKLALEEKTLFFKEIIKRSPIGVAIVDSKGVLLEVNQALADIIGYSKKELLDMNFEYFTHPEDLKSEWKLIEEMWNGKRTGYQMIKRYFHKDGSLVWVDLHASLVKNEKDEPILGFAFVQDITDRKKNEEKLRKSKEKLKLKLNNILSPQYEIKEEEFGNIINKSYVQAIMDDFYELTNIGIGIIDMKGNIIVQTGWQDICTKFHRIHPETKKNCIESDLYLSEEAQPGEFLAYKCKNNMWDIATPIILGGKRMANLFLGQFFYKDEKIDYDLFLKQADKYGFKRSEYLSALENVPRWDKEKIDCVMRFYTKFASLISQLSYSNLKLAKLVQNLKYTEKDLKRSRNRSEFYRDLLAHDIRNIFQNINSSAQLLEIYRKESKISEKGGELIEIIREQIKRGSLLISNVQKLSKIQVKDYNSESIHLNIILEDAINSVQNRFKEKQIKINKDISEDPISIRGGSLLLDAFENLLINGIMHNDNEIIELTIRTSNEIRENINYAKVEFIDNGRGILDKRKDTIFDRADQINKNIGGMGIGLSLVKKIVEDYGGKVWVEDRVNEDYSKGSNFIVLLEMQ
ncbi:MAG: putative Histidine kinase [Promethearchaeota archaeon]|nr:MAG: putative Histidine kinase [Candidatus Lokiarchaeota archaeon]